jgi:hypothetical protein
MRYPGLKGVKLVFKKIFWSKTLSGFGVAVKFDELLKSPI